MKWSKEVLENINFENITNREEKEKIAIQIAQKVKNGETIGFGSGSTSYLAVKEISKRIKKENIDILAIPTSHEIKMLCSELEIPTTTIMENKPDWCFDGADEVNDTNWLIKGRGAAMFREKLNIANSPVTYILADKTKFVRNLGEEAYIPIECYPEAINSVKEELLDLGATEIKLRTAVKKDGPLITENNNFIFSKYNIRLTWQSCIILSIPVSTFPQFLSKLQLYGSILRLNVLHIFMTLFFSQSIHFTHSDSSGTISRISATSHPSATHILSRISVLTFSFRPSLAMDALLIPAFSARSFFIISLSINSFHNFL